MLSTREESTAFVNALKKKLPGPCLRDVTHYRKTAGVIGLSLDAFAPGGALGRGLQNSSQRIMAFTRAHRLCLDLNRPAFSSQ